MADDLGTFNGAYVPGKTKDITPPDTLGDSPVQSGSGAPTHTPAVDSALYYDTATGKLYEWYDDTWNEHA